MVPPQNALLHCFLFLLSFHIPLSEQAFAGPYEFLIKNVSNCEVTGTRKMYLEGTPSFKKLSPDVIYFKGTIIFLIEAGDKLEAKLDVSQLKDGKRLDHAYTEETREICTSLKKYFPALMKDTMDSLHQEDCPIPPGNYSIDGPLDFTPSPALPDKVPYGSYVVQNLIFESGEMVGCFEYTCDFVPRKTKGKKKNKN